MQTAGLIFVSISGLMVDVYIFNDRLSVEMASKILAKMSSKLCIIFYNIFVHKSRFVLSIFGKSTG